MVLALLTRIDILGQGLACLLGLLPRKRKTGLGIGSQRQQLSPAMKGVAESPAVRATVDEEKQIHAVAIGDALARITRAYGLERLVRSNEVSGHVE